MEGEGTAAHGHRPWAAPLIAPEVQGRIMAPFECIETSVTRKEQVSMILVGGGSFGDHVQPETAALYKITITMDPGTAGIATMENGLPTCFSYGAVGYLFAEALNKQNYLLQLASNGILTPGPDGEVAPLTVFVDTGLEQPPRLKGFVFDDPACHGNLPGYSDNALLIRIYKDQDGYGPEKDIMMRFFLEFTKEINRQGDQWHLFNDDITVSENLFDPAMLDAVGGIYETTLIGPWVLVREGTNLNEEDPYRVGLPDFVVHLKIERVQ